MLDTTDEFVLTINPTQMDVFGGIFYHAQPYLHNTAVHHILLQALHTLQCLCHVRVTVKLKMLYHSNSILAVLVLIKCPMSVHIFHRAFKNVFTRLGLVVPILPIWWKCKMFYELLIFYMYYLAYVFKTYLCTMTEIITFLPCYPAMYEYSICFHFYHWYLLSTTDDLSIRSDLTNFPSK